MALGYANPYDLADNLPASVFQDWKNYYSIEPFGAWRDNFHAATVSAILANVNRAKETPPFRESDFFYMDHESREEYDAQKAAEQQAQFIRGLESMAASQKLEKQRKAAQVKAKPKGKGG